MVPESRTVEPEGPRVVPEGCRVVPEVLRLVPEGWKVVPEGNEEPGGSVSPTISPSLSDVSGPSWNGTVR